MWHFTVFYFSKIIYHSEEEGDLDMFVYIFRHPSHSSSFCLYPKLSKARIIVVEGKWNRVYAPRGPYAQIFLRFGLSFFCRGWGGYLQDSFISIIHSIMISLLHTSKWSDFMAPIRLLWKNSSKICVPSKMNMYPQMETPGGTCTPKQKYEWACWVGREIIKFCYNIYQRK